MPGLALVTAPTSEPVTLNEAKLFARITSDDEDAVIADLIAGARKALEDRWNWSFVTQTWDYFLDRFPVDEWYCSLPLLLPRQPLQSVTTVKYTPNGGSIQTMSASDYYVDMTSTSGPRIIPVIGKAWPGDLLRIANGVEVRIQTGYGLPIAVPEQLRLTVKQVMAYWYENRDELGRLPDWVDGAFETMRGGFAYA